MIELNSNTLTFDFPGVHVNAKFRMSFQRTLRIPDDNREYPLPAGLGKFPLFHVDDFAADVPTKWNDHGGVFMPLYQSEAMWINFDSETDYPFAVKIAGGKINAVTGKEWSNKLRKNPQDYAIVPRQPWLDGFAIRKGLIRQFVAMPLGEGFTAEAQISGKEEHGGLQIIAYPMKRDRYEAMMREKVHVARRRAAPEPSLCMMMELDSLEMGLSPGGLMHQEIYADHYGIDAWDTSNYSRCFVHLVNSQMFKRITGCRPPNDPISAEQYERNGIPWFDYWDTEAGSLDGSPILAELDSVAAKKIKKGMTVSEPRIDIEISDVIKINYDQVREGKF